jgi:hypothetical protein
MPEIVNEERPLQTVEALTIIISFFPLLTTEIQDDAVNLATIACTSKRNNQDQEYLEALGALRALATRLTQGS